MKFNAAVYVLFQRFEIASSIRINAIINTKTCKETIEY